MATVTEVINSLAERGVTLQPDDAGGLIVYGVSRLTDHEKDALRANKAIILEALSSQATNDKPAEQAPSYRLEMLDNLPLLPDDRKFIRRRLRVLPLSSHEKVFRLYRNRFINGMEAEQAEHKKDNAGRYRANTWLLEITEKGAGK